MNGVNQGIQHPRGLVRRTERATRIATCLVGMAVAVMAGLAALTGVGEPLVRLGYDMPFMVHRAGGADAIRIVYLTELDGQSLDRNPQARLLDRLAAEGARMVVYDLIFDRPSDDPAVDLAFAAAMRRFRGVDEHGEPLPGAVRRHVFLGCARDTSRKTGYAMETLVVPCDVLLDAADDFGLVSFDEDSFMIRRLSTGTPDEPSLAWKAAQAAGASLDEASRMTPRWFNFAGPPPGVSSRDDTVPIESVDAGTVLAGHPMSGFFRDKIVVVGGQPGIVGQQLGKDLFETPFHRFPVGGKLPLMSGVEVQANALANLLNGNWLIRSAEGLDRWMIILCGIVCGGMLSLLKPMRAIIAACALPIAAALVGLLTMHHGRLWIPWSVIAFLQVPVALVWGISANTYLERYFRIKLSVEQLALRTAFSKYLSPQMLERLTTEGFRTRLGGEKVHAAILFTDLEDFTELCARIRNPERIVETLNDYFQRTTASVFEHQGIIVKYIGDAIFAAWGAPIADPNAALHAARAAWKLFQNDKLHIEGRAYRTRIGVHFGEVVAGNIGSEQRIDYTLIGDAVNLASRLEGLNKMLGTHILLSGEAAASATGEFLIRRIGEFIVKGRDEAVAVHEMLGPPVGSEPPEWLAVFEDAVRGMRGGRMDEAARLFQQVDSMRAPDGDGPSKFYLERIRLRTVSDGGVVRLAEK